MAFRSEVSQAAMRVLAFLTVAGLVLLALLFLADASPKKKASPAIVTSQRTGLPEPARHSGGIHILTSATAPAPDMTSQAVLDAQPKPDHEALTRIEPAARAARAEAPPKTTRDAPQASIENQRNQFQQTDLVDRFSIRGQ
jgi:hypothetical protein